MSHGSGLQVDESTRANFSSLAQRSDVLFIKFQISKSLDAFNIARDYKIESSSNARTDFQSFAKALEEREPCFLVCRLRTDDNSENKWLLIYYMPDGASVKDRMVYASSLSALRQGLGNSMFLPLPFNVQNRRECSFDDYLHSTKKGGDESTTNEERIRSQNELASHMAMSDVKVSAIVGLPIKSSEEAVEAIRSISRSSSSSSSSSSGHDTIIFSLHPNSEVLLVERRGSHSLNDLASILPADEPRYVLHHFPHTNPADNSAVDVFLFVYYCPQNIKPKLKMFYSTCKAVVIKMCEQLEVKIHRSLEVSERTDISVAAALHDLYPPAEVKQVFTKPAKPGRGKARLIQQ